MKLSNVVMLTQREREIVKYLIEADGYVTSAELAKKIKCCTKTIRIDIKNMSSVLMRDGVSIKTQPKLGNKIEYTDIESFNKFKKKIYTNSKEGVINEKYVSVNIETKILYYLLFTKNKKDINKLCNRFYLTPSSLLYYIKKIGDKISVYNLEIKNGKKNGFQIIGKEFEKRICMSFYIFEYLENVDRIDNFTNYIDISTYKKVDSIVSAIFEKEKFNMSYINYNNLIGTIVISINEIYFDNPIEPLKDKFNSKLVEKEIDVSRKIAKELTDNFNITIDENEIMFIALQLLGKKSMINNYDSNITNEFSSLVTGMLERIKETTDVDLTNDDDLIHSLNQHMIPLFIRLKYGIKSQNLSLNDIRRNCVYPYNLAAIGCSYLKDKLDLVMNEDEIGFIALYIKIALDKMTDLKSKKRVLFISEQQESNMKFYAHELEKKFEKYFLSLDRKRPNEINKKLCNSYNLIVTTKDLPFETKTKTIKIEGNITFADMKKIEDYLSNKNTCREYINTICKENLFVKNLDVKNKKECIHYICNELTKLENVPSNFEEYVLYREEFGTTDFGELVAIPHPYIPVSDTSFMYVAFLKRLVNWGKNKIKVVFLLSPSRTDRPPNELYTLLSEVISSTQHCNELYESQNFEEFISKINKYIL